MSLKKRQQGFGSGMMLPIKQVHSSFAVLRIQQARTFGTVPSILINLHKNMADGQKQMRYSIFRNGFPRFQLSLFTSGIFSGAISMWMI